jgi:hypothetical protein
MKKKSGIPFLAALGIMVLGSKKMTTTPATMPPMYDMNNPPEILPTIPNYAERITLATTPRVPAVIPEPVMTITGNDGNTYSMVGGTAQITYINPSMASPVPVPDGFVQNDIRTLNYATGQQMNVDPFGNVTIQNGAIQGFTGESGTWNGIPYANYSEYLALQNAWMASAEGKAKMAEYQNKLRGLGLA